MDAEAHLRFLLTLACGKAATEKREVVVVGTKGSSYARWKTQMQTFPENAMAMHAAGYSYTARIPT